jgi:hypothetical protein
VTGPREKSEAARSDAGSPNPVTLCAGLTLYGISADSVYSHRAFAGKDNLQFPLLVDSLGDVAEACGVRHGEIAGHRQLARRALFVVDTDRPVGDARATDNPERLPDVDCTSARTDPDATAVNPLALHPCP